MDKTEKLIADLCKRHSKLRDIRLTNWENHWEKIARFVIPNRKGVQDWQYKVKGEEKFNTVYDASAIHFNELLASHLHSLLTNPFSQWFELTTGNRELDSDEEVKEYLQNIVRIVHQTLNDSNFQTEIHELYMDLGSIGTGAIYTEEDDDDIVRFRAFPIFELHIDEDYKGVVDTVFVTYKMTVRQVIQKYGEEVFNNSKISGLKNNESQEVEVIQAIYPRKEYNPSKKDIKNYPFASIHYLSNEKVLLQESGFQEFPFSVPRFMKISGEVYGRSPSMKALPDIMMINSMMKQTIRAAQKATNPVIAIPDNAFIGPLNYTPGATCIYRPGSASRDTVFPIESGANPSIGLEIMNNVRERIKESFYVDQMQLRDGPQMTATEVNALLDQQLRMFGPIVGRLGYEFLPVVINRVIGILNRKKLLPIKPEKLKDKSTSIRFSSQMARAQRMSETANVDRFLGSLGAIVQIDPTIYDYFNPEGFVKYKAAIESIPHDILRKTEEVEAIRSNREQQQAMQAQLQQGLAQSEIAKNMAPAMEAQQAGMAL